MRLDFVMLADSAVLDTRTGKLDIIGGGVTHITAPYLPFPTPAVCIVIRFFLEEGDTPRDRTLSIRLYDPGESERFTIDASIKADAVSGRAHPGEEPTLVVVGRLEGIVFEAHGRYRFELLVDGDRIAQSYLALVPDQEHD